MPELFPVKKITKGKLGGKSFLYNPAAMQDEILITYNDILIPGMSYPIMAYAGGERRSITFDIYLNDRIEAGITKGFIDHLNNFLPRAGKRGYQFHKPSRLTFAFGWFVKDCYLTGMSTQYTAFSPTLQPIEATVTVTLAIIQ